MSAIVCGLAVTRSALPGAFRQTSWRSSRGAPSRRSCSPCGASGGRAGRGARRVRGRARRRRAPAVLGPAPCRPPGRASCWAACPSTRWGSAWPLAPRPQRRHRAGAAGVPSRSLGGRTCARPHDRRAHRRSGDALSCAARLARAPGVARGGGSSMPHARRVLSPRLRLPASFSPWRRRRPLPGSAASRTGVVMRRKPLAAMFVLLSAALVLGGECPKLDAGWGSALRAWL